MAGAEGSTTEGAEKDLEFSRAGEGPNFEFAFNSQNFSDRLLRIEVVAEIWCKALFTIEVVNIFFHTKLANTYEPSYDWRGCVEGVLRVKTIHINSAILAVRSPFFLKLFSNGMKESDQTHPTLRVADSDENALMELLNFMYSGKLTTTEPSLLLDILMAADKFEVVSCMRHCCQLLTSLPWTTESALLCLDHPCVMSMAAEVQLLISAAKDFLVNKYKDYNKLRKEVTSISLAGIKAILSSTDIHVACEDYLFVLMLKWARVQYPDLEERREILNSHLLPLLRFSHMTYKTLQEILACTANDIDHEQVTKCINGVLLCKAYPAHKPGALAACAPSCQQFAERDYKYRHLKVVAFDQPRPQVIAYMDLKHEECSQLFPSEKIFSHPFHVAGQGFILGARCCKADQGESYSFGLLLHIDLELKGSTCVTVDYEFAARTRPSRQFVSKLNGRHTFSDKFPVGSRYLFWVPWQTFMADDSIFIDGVLHLRVDLTVLQEDPV
ncbi:hypothetical protein VPH35_093952 [Triticum aestivum]